MDCVLSAVTLLQDQNPLGRDFISMTLVFPQQVLGACGERAGFEGAGSTWPESGLCLSHHCKHQIANIRLL